MDGLFLWNRDFWLRSPILWMAASVAASAMVAWAGEAIRRGKLPWLKRMISLPGALVLEEAVQAVYFLVPPFALVALGWLSPALLGVSVELWLPRLFEGLGLGILLLLALVAVVWISRRQERRFSVHRSWVIGLREAIYQQSHWAFYRAAWGAAGLGLYAAVWSGVATVLVEWALNPSNLRRTGLRKLAMRIALLFATAALFYQSSNLWLCMALHWGAVWLAGEEW